MFEMFEKFGNICKGVIGRNIEVIAIKAAMDAGKHILLEGPPGTSKSTLLRAIAREANIPFYMVEGNIDLTPAKIVGYFNPAKVMADSYDPKFFEKGPLTKAMEEGGILYLEEFNRMPADVANVLITPMEEGEMNVPRYGLVKAIRPFTVIAAQNPFDDVGTVRVSRAFMDRICLIKLDYQPENEEIEIVKNRTNCQRPDIIKAAVSMVRKTREHPDVKLGASVRAAIDLVDIYKSLQRTRNQTTVNFVLAAQMALSNKVWLNETTSRSPNDIIDDIWDTLKVQFRDINSSNDVSESKENIQENTKNDEGNCQKKKLTVS